MAPNQLRSWVKWRAAMKAACSAAMPWSLSISLSSGIQYSTGKSMRGMYLGEAAQVEVTMHVSEGGRGIREASGEAVKVGEGLEVRGKGMRWGSTVVVVYMFCV
jgi:hypothetical protein